MSKQELEKLQKDAPESLAAGSHIHELIVVKYPAGYEYLPVPSTIER